MIKRSIKYKKKYPDGGKLDPRLYNQFGDIAGELGSQVDPSLGTVLKRTGQGAALGSAVPGIGTAIGAGVGLLAGGVESIFNADKQAEDDRLRGQYNTRVQDMKSRSRLIGYDSTGSNTNQIYAKLGGKISRYASGGNLKQVSSQNVEVTGPSHENGGVSLDANTEVEGGETINKDFVFSEELGFAQRHKPIARSIGKIEKKPQNDITRKSLELLHNKEEALKQEQELLKQTLGIAPVGTREQYELGGETDPIGDPTKTKKENIKSEDYLTEQEINTARRLGLIKSEGHSDDHYGDTKALYGDKYRGYDYLDFDTTKPLTSYPESLRRIAATEPAFPNAPGRIVARRSYSTDSTPPPIEQPRFVDKVNYASYSPGSESSKKAYALIDSINRKKLYGGYIGKPIKRR